MQRHPDGGTIAGDTLRITRDLPGPIARVRRYLTEPDALVTWLGRATIPRRSAEDVVLRFVHEPGEPAADAATMHGTTTIVDAPHVLEAELRGSSRPDFFARCAEHEAACARRPIEGRAHRLS